MFRHIKTLSYLVFGIVASVLIVQGCSNGASVSASRSDYNYPIIKVDGTGEEADRKMYFQQGYEVAKDRLLQIDMLRRTAQGGLAEIFGELAEEKDTDVISVGLREASENSLKKIEKNHPAAVAGLRAYADGVNQYISEIMNDNDHELIKKYRSWTRDKDFSFNPAVKNPDGSPKFTPWSPLDSVSVCEAIAFYLSSELGETKIVSRLAAVYAPTFGNDKAEFAEKLITFLKKKIDFRPVENTFILEPSARKAVAKSPEVPSDKKEKLAGAALALSTMKARSYPFAEGARNRGAGSNNWVISAKAAGGGKTLIANDPHLPLLFPSTFMEMAIGPMRGMNLVGTPGILIGHNQNISWVSTNQPGRVDDVYIELLDKTNKFVSHNNQWKAIDTHLHKLKVRLPNGQLRTRDVTLRWVPHHGPIFSDHMKDIASGLNLLQEKLNYPNIALSYQWAGHAGTTEIAAILAVGKASNFVEFTKALDLFEVGAQNIVYADKQGNIGYYSHANYPIRKYMWMWAPVIPVLGTGEMDWERDKAGNFVWRKQVPQLYNPAKGYIVTANNDPFGNTLNKSFTTDEDFFGTSFSTGVRAKRITDMIEEKLGRISIDDVKKMQFDHKDLLALKFVDFIKKINFTNPDSQAVKNMLLSWDGVAARNRSEPYVMYEFLMAMVHNYFDVATNSKDDPKLIDDLEHNYMTAKSIFHYVNDSKGTATENEAIAFLTKSFDNAVAEVLKGSAVGRGVAGMPNWGQKNQMRFANPLDGVKPPLLSSPLERDGTVETVDVAVKAWGPNFRLIMQLEPGKPIDGVNVMSVGNYGTSDPTQDSRWLNELYMWRENERRPLTSF